MKPAALAAIVVSAAAAGAAFYLARQRATPVEPPPPLATQAPMRELVETIPQFQLADREGHLRSLADWDEACSPLSVSVNLCANSMDDPRTGLRCRPETLPVIACRAFNGSASSGLSAGS